MDKLNKLSALCLVITFFIAGCGKKKCTTQKPCNSTVAASDSAIPLTDLSDTTDLLDDDAFAEFAFLDEETLAPEISEKNPDLSEKTVPAAFVAQNDDFDLDVEAALVEDDADATFAFQPVKFDFNKNEIRADQKAVVARDISIAQQAVDQGKKTVIEGHSCQIGSAGYNVALSQRRAEAVKAEMVKSGIPAENIKTVGYGYERPLVWSDAKERGQLLKELSPNRRAEILVN